MNDKKDNQKVPASPASKDALETTPAAAPLSTSTEFSCPGCCAKAGEQHAADCTARDLAGAARLAIDILEPLDRPRLPLALSAAIGVLRSALSEQSQVATAGPSPTPAMNELIAKHTEMLETNPYAYFELAYTRQTGWMVFLCDRPAGGTVGTPEFGAGRTVLAQGQGSTPEEACRAAVAALGKSGGAA